MDASKRFGVIWLKGVLTREHFMESILHTAGMKSAVSHIAKLFEVQVLQINYSQMHVDGFRKGPEASNFICLCADAYTYHKMLSVNTSLSMTDQAKTSVKIYLGGQDIVLVCTYRTRLASQNSKISCNAFRYQTKCIALSVI